MKKIYTGAVICSALITGLFSCRDSYKRHDQAQKVYDEKQAADQSSAATALRFKGALMNGMKGDSIFFNVSADRKQLTDLTFKGYWYCDGKLESQPAAGPQGSFNIVDGKVNDHISEPPNGGSTAWRFDLTADIKETETTGTFRMNINNLGCNTGTLKFTAVPY